MSGAESVRSEVRAALRGGLARLSAAQERAVAPVQGGRPAEGAAAVREVLLAWGGFLQSVQQALPAFPEAEASRVVERLGATRDWLQGIQRALPGGQWVEIGDLLTLEGAELVQRWESALDPSAHPSGGESSEAARSR